jgi:DnaJ family protein C protein 7
VVTGGTAGLGDEPPKEDPAWRLAEEQKERGNRRYAIKSWAEANVCYQKAISELRKHAAWGTATAEGRALNTRAASYHANSAAALMQLARMADAVAECDAALRADSKLGKALLRVAHVQLMLGDTDEARRFYLEAAQVGNSAESEAGLKACADDEQQAARLHSELIMCRRAAASTMGSAASSQQLKGLLNALETACTRSPHNLTLRSLQAEALSASGRMTEAHALCEAQLATPAAHKGHASLWHCTLGRVLYDSSLLPEAADKLSESLARPNAPAGAKPLLRLVQKLETERTAGNNAFKRGDWTQAVEAYTRALAVDPTHARFNALLYCNRGAAHAKNNALQQALADCSAAIALNRSYAKAYLRRGELRARCGDRSRALEDLGAAQRLDASGPVGLEAQRRVAELRKEQAREAANAARDAAGAAAGAGSGWDRARAHHGGSSGYAGAGASSRGAGSERPSTAVAPPPKAPNHYEVLGVEPSADADAIRKAYKKLCLKFHPDKHASSPMAEKAKAQDAFLAVQKAYDVLSDVTQRRTYDLEQRSRSRAGGLGGFGGARGAGPFGFASGMEDDLFSAFYGRHAQARAPPGRR